MRRWLPVLKGSWRGGKWAVASFEGKWGALTQFRSQFEGKLEVPTLM